MKHKYLDNLLFHELSKEYQNLFKNVQKRDGFEYGKSNYKILSDKEGYVNEIMTFKIKIHGLVDQLYFINTFIRRYPHGKFYKENGINKLNYIQYHTEVFFHKIHTILEVMKLMVNEVYMLNIPSKECNWKRITSVVNKDIKPLKIIDAYFTTFDKFINHRHVNTHRAIYNDKAMREIEIDFGFGYRELVESIGEKVDEEMNHIYPKFLLDYKIKQFKKERLKLVSKTIEITNDYLFLFLNSLLPEFKKQLIER